MSVDRRVPIQTTVESGVHRARIAHVVFVIDRVIRFVGIFLLNALQRERSEVRSLRLREGMRCA